MKKTPPSPKDSSQPEGAAGLAAPLGSASRPILLQHGETGRMLAWDSRKPIPHGYSEIIPVLNIWEIGSR